MTWFRKPFYFIRRVKDHRIRKDDLLADINVYKKPYQTIDEEEYYSYVSNSDWDNNREANWFNYAFSIKDRKSYVEFIRRKYKKDFVINRSWFNQYYSNSGSDHPLHDHFPGCDLTNIYYLELKDKSLRTIVEHPVTGKEFVPRVNEGDMLILPSKIWHKSPRNYTDTRKTVISFNTSFLI